jgi:hypothetical protein
LFSSAGAKEFRGTHPCAACACAAKKNNPQKTKVQLAFKSLESKVQKAACSPLEAKHTSQAPLEENRLMASLKNDSQQKRKKKVPTDLK